MKSIYSKFSIPNELKCRSCHGLLRDAVVSTCCGDGYCDECLQKQLLIDSHKCINRDCDFERFYNFELYIMVCNPIIIPSKKLIFL